MKAKYYGWVNTKVNIYFGTKKNGEWRRVNILMYYWLKLNGFIVKKRGE